MLHCQLTTTWAYSGHKQCWESTWRMSLLNNRRPKPLDRNRFEDRSCGENQKHTLTKEKNIRVGSSLTIEGKTIIREILRRNARSIVLVNRIPFQSRSLSSHPQVISVQGSSIYILEEREIGRRMKTSNQSGGRKTPRSRIYRRNTVHHMACQRNGSKEN